MPEREPLILVVDDEEKIRDYVQRVLQAQGYATVEAGNGLEALPLMAHQPDLVILDMMMPYMDGLDTCRTIRQSSQCPVIILSAKGDEARKIAAFEEGADDYLTKPFSAAELAARVKAVLRRAAQGGKAAPAQRIVRFHTVEIDLDGNSVTRDGLPLHLTRTELAILKLLAEHAGKVIDHRMLLQAVWGPEYGDETEYLHAYMRRLRRKLEEEPGNPRWLITEPGIGYRLLLA